MKSTFRLGFGHSYKCKCLKLHNIVQYIIKILLDSNLVELSCSTRNKLQQMNQLMACFDRSIKIWR